MMIILILFTFVPSSALVYMTFLVQLSVFLKLIFASIFLLAFPPHPPEQLFRSSHILQQPWKCLFQYCQIISQCCVLPLRYPFQRYSPGCPWCSCSHMECGSLNPLFLESSLSSLLCGSPWFHHFSYSFLTYTLIFVNTYPSVFLKRKVFDHFYVWKYLHSLSSHLSNVFVLLARMATVILPTPFSPTILQPDFSTSSIKGGTISPPLEWRWLCDFLWQIG